MRRLLTISKNRAAALAKRNDALALAGFSVVTPRTPTEAPSLLNEREFDAVLIGDSVGPEERRTLIGEIRDRHPSSLVCFGRVDQAR